MSAEYKYIDEIRSALGNLREPIKFVDRLAPHYHELPDIDRETRGLKLMHTLRQQACKISKLIITGIQRSDDELLFARLLDLLITWDLLRELDLEETAQAEVEADVAQEIAECLYFVTLWPKIVRADSYHLDLDAELKNFKGLRIQSKIAGLADVATEIGKAVTEKLLTFEFISEADFENELNLKLRTIDVVEEILEVLTEELYGIPPNVINNTHRFHQGLSDKVRTVRGFLARIKGDVITLRREMFVLKQIGKIKDPSI